MKTIFVFFTLIFLAFVSSNCFAESGFYNCQVENVYSFDLEHRTPMTYEGSKFTVDKDTGAIDGDKFANIEYGKMIHKIINISKGNEVYPYEQASVNKLGVMEYLCVNEFEDGYKKSFFYKNSFWMFTGYCY